jgi:hypothetical protein
LLTARKLLQTKNHDVEMCLRGVLRGFGHSRPEPDQVAPPRRILGFRIQGTAGLPG